MRVPVERISDSPKILKITNISLSRKERKQLSHGRVEDSLDQEFGCKGYREDRFRDYHNKFY